MKRIFSVCLSFFLLSALLISPVFAAGRGKVTLTGEFENLARGDVITTNLELNRNPGIESILVTLKIDAEKLELYEIEDSELLPQFDFSTDEEGGEIVLRWHTTEDRGVLTDTGYLAKILFRVKDDALLTDTRINVEINEHFFDAVDEKGEAVPFETAGLTVPLNCYHVNTEKALQKEASFQEAGISKVTCLDCRKEWEEPVLPVVESDDKKTLGEVQIGEYEEEDTKKLRTDYIFGGTDYETAEALFGDTIVRLFRVSFIRNDSVFDPKGEDPIYLTVDFDLPENFMLYRIFEGQGEKVGVTLEEGKLIFNHANCLFALVSEEAHLPPVTTTVTTTTKKENTTTTTLSVTTTLSPQEREKRGAGIAIAAGIVSVVLFGTGAVLILRKKERF